MDIIENITRLPLLETVRIKKGLWLSTEMVRCLVDGSPRLRSLNLREAGMKEKMPWAMKCTREKMAEILNGEIPRKPGNGPGVPNT